MSANIYNLFKFLEKKKGTKTPLRVKFIYAPDELTDEELNVEGSLYLQNTQITSLPNNLKVEGNLNLSHTKIDSLPDNLQVEDNLDLANTPITSLPDNLKIGGGINLANTPITSLPDNLQVGGNFMSIGSKISSIPNNLKVGRILYLSNTPLAEKYSEKEIRNMIEKKGGYVGYVEGASYD